MSDYGEAFIEIEVAQIWSAIAVAGAGRNGEVGGFGDSAADFNMRCVIQRIASKYERVILDKIAITAYSRNSLTIEFAGFAGFRGPDQKPIHPSAISSSH